MRASACSHGAEALKQMRDLGDVPLTYAGWVPSDVID